MLIHHMIEYVIREGPMFEAMIMNKEINNPMFRFLFDNQSPAHTYYRWKLFSLLQGDSQKEWSLKEFRMFKGGSIWRPPPMNMYTQGMPEELIERDEERKGGLSPAQRDRLEQLIRHMTPERLKVADAMVFCIEHAEAADEICDCILESLSNNTTLLCKKIARLYLVSDILHNCSIKMTNASNYRRCLESRLVDVFEQAHQTFIGLESRLKAESYKLRVLQIFRAWDDWAVYPRDFLLKLKSTFLGAQIEEVEEEEERVASPDIPPPDDIVNADLDGVPLDGAALLKGAYGHAYDDIDGVPMDDDLDGKPFEEELPRLPPSRRPEGAFVPSRWEEVDPDLIEEQAMTTSKWELLEESKVQREPIPPSQQGSGDESQPAPPLPREPSPASNDSSRDGQEEARRAKLREIEVKVVQYQDELESGKRQVKAGWTIPDQIEHHRRKLLRKAEKAENKETAAPSKPVDKVKGRSISPDDSTSDSRYKRSKRSKSSTPSPPSKRSTYRSRSRSPYSSSSRRRRSRSPRRREDSPPRRRRSRSPDTSSPAHKRRHSSSRHKHKHRH